MWNRTRPAHRPKVVGLGQVLAVGVATVAVLNALSALSMPVPERKVAAVVIAAWLVLLLLHAAAYQWGERIRARLGLGAYAGVQAVVLFAIALSRPPAPLKIALYMAAIAELVALAGSKWGAKGTIWITTGAVGVLVLASLVTADLYRATTDGLILAVTGLVAHAIAGLLHRPAAPGASPVQVVSPHAAMQLSAREAEVLRELVNGARNSDIAATLGISERTVKAHLGSIYQKLGVESRSAAVAAAMGRKLVLVLALVGLTGATAQRPPPDRVVTITIDDLPAVAVSSTAEWPRVTEHLLATLRRHHVQAVGFVNEAKLYVNGALDSSRVALLEAWLDAGQELGNHTFAHRGAHQTPLAEYLDGITRGEQVTRALARRAGRPYRYFRHPQLHAGRSLPYRRGVERFLSAHGYTIAPVTVDNQEWVYARAYIVAEARGDSALTQRVVADYFRHLDSAFAYSEGLSRLLFEREIPLVLLLHANQINADHLDAILSRLEARGYAFSPLEPVLADSAYRSRDTYVGATGPSWLIRWASTRGIAIPPEPREERWIAALASEGP